MRCSAPSGGHSVNFSLCLPPAWCLRNEGVSSVLLGTSNPEQLTENLGAIQVRTHTWPVFASCVCLLSYAALLPRSSQR